MLIIGSQALAQHRLLPPGRVPKDVDVIMRWEKFQEQIVPSATVCYPLSGDKWKVHHEKFPGSIIEVDIAWPGTTNETLLRRHLFAFDSIGEPEIATPEECLALKLSHRYKKNSVHFMKTMLDIRWLRSWGIQLDDTLKQFVKDRERETYVYAHPRLNQSKAGFFQDRYKFDHDSIHVAVAKNGQPVYHLYTIDGAEVACDMDVFEKLDYYVKLRAVYEEAAVLAIERSLVPHPGVWSPEQAFEYALQKVATSITSGRFREFAWENFFEVMNVMRNEPVNFYDAFHAGVLNGVVKEAA